jgi:hypothetical protein
LAFTTEEVASTSEAAPVVEGPTSAVNFSRFGTINFLSMDKADRGENDTEVDEILRALRRMKHTGEKPFASTVLLPLMKKIKYDPR